MSDAYAAAGVDTQAGERAVELMRSAVEQATRPEAVGSLGGFAGLFDASALSRYRRPLLATATDGVGTKIAVARAMDVHHTIGQDLVAMVVDDLVVCGAEPLFLTDYIACGRVVPERIAAIVTGIAEGCRLAGCALLGGETAEHPGLMGDDEYDVAAAGTAVVEADRLLGPDRVLAGDALIALASSGLHSNGYSLVRRVLLSDGSEGLGEFVPSLGRTLGAELLEPTAIYARQCLALRDELGEGLHALSHVTGGGLAANLARVMPSDLTAVLDRSTWTPAPIFQLIADRGGIPAGDMERTFNMGVGMVAVVSESAAPQALATLAEAGVTAWPAGSVRERGDGELGDSPAKGGTGGAAVVLGRHPS